MAEWLLSTRGPDGRLSGNLPVKTLSAVIRHMGVGAGEATVPWSLKAHERLTEGAGVVLRRDGVVLCTGFLVEITEDMPGGMKVTWVSEQVLLQGHLVIPNPAAAGDAQTTVPRWTRTGVASTVMTALIAEQVGPAAHVMWRVPGLTVGADPLVGGTVSAAIRYGSPDLLAELATLSASSGTDLGVRVDAVDGGLLAQVVAPVESATTARFSVDLGNLTSYSFTRKAPKVTDVIVAGKAPDAPDGTTGEAADDWKFTHAPQTTATSTDPITTAWGRRIWTFKDQSSIDDPTKLQQAADEEVTDGAAQVSLTCTLRDSERLKFGVGWGLGHRVTVYVGRPAGPKTEVVDVVREVAFEYGPEREKITPAIGSAGATALPTLPSRQTLNKIRSRLAGLERSN